MRGHAASRESPIQSGRTAALVVYAAGFAISPSATFEWVVAGPTGTYLFLYGGDAVTPAEETSVISSLQFLDALPTP